jgi:hypothetical protein
MDSTLDRSSDDVPSDDVTGKASSDDVPTVHGTDHNIAHT